MLEMTVFNKLMCCIYTVCSCYKRFLKQMTAEGRHWHKLFTRTMLCIHLFWRSVSYI